MKIDENHYFEICDAQNNNIFGFSVIDEETCFQIIPTIDTIQSRFPFSLPVKIFKILDQKNIIKIISINHGIIQANNLISNPILNVLYQQIIQAVLNTPNICIRKYFSFKNL